jgi:peptidylprolyl isomerase
MKSKIFKSKIMVFLIIFAVFIVAMVAYSSMSGKKTTSTVKVLLVTTMGNITVELFDDMPITAGNFKNLVQQGTYDGTIFHRVVPDFVVQGGDPTGTGLGDPNIPSIQDELPNKHGNTVGTLAMANKGPNTGSSQFFINLKDNSANLDSDYPVFGKVVEGIDVVDGIGNVPTNSTSERPLQDVILAKAELIG